jgi:hypothetical protein
MTPLQEFIKKERITPELAKLYLEKNFADQRKVIQADVDKYAHAMTNGLWRENGNPLKFDEAGFLVDGQHRLLAIIQSGVAVEMYVMYGVSVEAVPTIDTGRHRSGRDAIVIAGLPADYADAVSALVRRIILFKEGSRRVLSGKHRSGRQSAGNRERKIGELEIVEFYKQHPNLLSYAERGKGLHKAQQAQPGLATLLSPSDYVFLLWHFEHTNAERAFEFLRQIAQYNDNGNPLFRPLVRRLEKDFMTGAEKLELLEATFNAYILGRQRTRTTARETTAPRLDTTTV